MNTIGIRVSPNALTFAVYDSAAGSILNIEAIRLPFAFEVPDKLKYARSNLLDVLREYDIEVAAIRATEPSAMQLNIERVEIEGVVKEAFASSGLRSFYVFHISSIASRLGVDRADVKPMIEGQKSPDVENWTDLSKEQREAVLSAMGAANA